MFLWVPFGISSVLQSQWGASAYSISSLIVIKNQGWKKRQVWRMANGALRGGEIGICLRVTVVSTCNFICAAHLENTHWVLPYGFSVPFAFPTLSASSCQTYVGTKAQAVKMYSACMEAELCHLNMVSAGLYICTCMRVTTWSAACSQTNRSPYSLGCIHICNVAKNSEYRRCCSVFRTLMKGNGVHSHKLVRTYRYKQARLIYLPSDATACG